MTNYPYGETYTAKLDLIGDFKVRQKITPSIGYTEKQWNAMTKQEQEDIALTVAAQVLTKNRIALYRNETQLPHTAHGTDYPAG